MKISHIQTTDKPSSIIVRNYDNKSIVHVPNYIIREYYKPLEDEIGQFRIKYKDKCFGILLNVKNNRCLPVRLVDSANCGY